MKIYNTVIIGRKQVANNTLEVTLRRPDGFDYKAGQYIQLELPAAPHKDPGSSSRVFSIVTSPNDAKKIAVAFRRSGSGFKRSIETLPLGSEVMLQGPYGYITLHKELQRPLVCIAGGIGITPCLSMIRFARESNLNTPITLVYANWQREDAAYLQELQKISKQSKWLTLQAVYGLIDPAVIHKAAASNDDSMWLLAGPPGMVDELRNTLFAEGIDEHRIFCEEFTGY